MHKLNAIIKLKVFNESIKPLLEKHLSFVERERIYDELEDALEECHNTGYNEGYDKGWEEDKKENDW